MQDWQRIEAVQRWLQALITAEGGVAGTVHVQRGRDLLLVAAINIPDAVIAAVAELPHGKGMAGAAQAGRRPVSTCNLQTDQDARIQPGAHAVGVQTAIALPSLDANGAVMAVVGIAWAGELALDADRQSALLRLAASVPLDGVVV